MNRIKKSIDRQEEYLLDSDFFPVVQDDNKKTKARKLRFRRTVWRQINAIVTWAMMGTWAIAFLTTSPYLGLVGLAISPFADATYRLATGAGINHV